MLSATPTGSRRAVTRFPAGLPAEIRLPAARFRCVLANLSRDGALVCGRFPAPPDDRVGLLLKSAGGDLHILLRARVVRVDRPSHDRTRLAVVFVDVRPEERAGIERLVSRVVEGSGTGLLATLSPTAKTDEIRRTLSQMPAAHRIGLAARAQARERRMLREDSNPLVLEALARNPAATIEEVVALARKPLLRPDTVALLVDDPRFRRHEELQILLASHRQATLQVAEQAAGRLGAKGRSRLLTRPNLHPALRKGLLAGKAYRTL